MQAGRDCGVRGASDVGEPEIILSFPSVGPLGRMVKTAANQVNNCLSLPPKKLS